MNGPNKEKLFFFNNNVPEIKVKPNSLEHAYLAIINKDLKSANIIFSHLDSPRAKWGSILISILNGFMEEYPTYFQIRNFFEIDLDFLINNNLIDYVEQCLGALDVLSKINREIFKYAARVMYENKLYKAAFKYMEKSKQVNYNDPELHFMLAKYYFGINKYSDSYFYINECLKLLPDYYPAISLKEEIEQLSI